MFESFRMLSTCAALAASLALAVPQTGLSQAAPDPKDPSTMVGQWATEVAGKFLKGDLDAISARFDPKLGSLLSPQAFREGWVGIESRSGKLGSIGEPVVRKSGTVDAAVMAAKFEKAELILSLVFDDQGRISSIRFAPASLGAASSAPPVEFRAPPYADPGKFSDTRVKIGAAPWELSGTVSMPAGKGPFPGVVLVHGSGPLDQDETVGGTKVFRDLAWGLASQGIAVLRYEKRTRAHAEKMGAAPFTVKEEVVDDAVAAAKALRAMKGVDRRRIVVLGHSLGGYLAPRIASADGTLAGVVLLAGSARAIPDLFLEQVEYLVSNGAAREEDLASVRQEAARVRALDPGQPPPADRVLGAPVGYWLDLRSYDAPALARANGVPVLVLQGGRDYQVTTKDLEGWRRELGKERFAAFHTFPEANHLFVFGEGKSLPAEYAKPGNVAADVVNVIAKWVKGLKPRG
jgi:dienelactone hydrolase